MKFDRSFYLMENATKVCDKNSDAVAYFRRSETAPYYFHVQVFFGKQARPVLNSVYSTQEKMEKVIKACFENRQRRNNKMKEIRDERKGAGNNYLVGDVLYTSWGYDQTNVDFYQVVEILPKSIRVRAIGATSEGGGPAGNRVSPLKDNFLPDNHHKAGLHTCRVNGSSCKIDGHYAYKTKSGKSHYATDSMYGH